MNTVNDIRPVKDKLRLLSRQYRLSLSKEEKARIDRKIANKFLNMWQYRESELILTYVSTEIEVDTRYIIETALKDGKRVAVPKCIEGTRNMDFYLIDGFSCLEKGMFSVLEPLESCRRLHDFTDKQAVCIVPALMFDLAGYRLGYGYNECVKEGLPHGKYDRRVEKIVTHSRVIITNKPKGGRNR